MRYYIIAGEASGDLHGSNLIKALAHCDPEATFRFWGGELMQAQGGTLVKHYKDLAFMGFVEVLQNLSTIVKNLKFCKQDISAFKPDALIFIDYPGFNLRIAKWAKQKGYTTHFYISPQIWAWKESRINAIKRDIDAMYVILPFEKEFYEDKHNFPVHFVGHPLIDAISEREQCHPDVFLKENELGENPIIAVLPGSRKQEIKKMLSVMLSVVPDFPDYQFVIAGAPNQDRDFYKPFIKTENVHLVLNKTYDLLSISTAALVTSGTATLEAALFKVPEVVCYKGSSISYAIAKRIVKLEFISLVNLILKREAVTELIQNDFKTKRLKKELHAILNTERRNKLFEDYYTLENMLGGKGASAKTAQLIHQALLAKK
ncbi:MAG: lipid-A-disaccharide synthase [Flavobacteriaceae bacterium]|nr:lipid-A-disaccharide synthase [Flavobacteriaceae bacterium]